LYKLTNQEAVAFLADVEDNSVDLVLMDPPYITSRDSGMDRWMEHVEKQNELGSTNIKTEEQWNKLKTEEEWEKWFASSKIPEADQDKHLKRMKEDYLKYGSIYGTKYAKQTDFGDWDKEFTLSKLEEIVEQLHKKLKKGGTLIAFFDQWKITQIKDILEDNNFKQLRIIQWEKTNPQPINSKRNYLSNCREMAVTAVKVGKPCFNSEYDKGYYKYPIPGGKDRIHPTQKSLPLCEELIKKHSNPSDIVLDCFAGSATTAIAALKTDRRFIGCELEKEYYEKAIERINRNMETENDS